MGWMQALYETYEKSRTYIGREDQLGCILLPIGHSTQNAQIEIVINLTGYIKGARKVEKAGAVTMIPVTEDSGSRSSGIAPHPLCDKLCYMAGDYKTYFTKKKVEEYYQAYSEQLEGWVCAGCHPYVHAIYSYVKRQTMIHDLVELGILQTDESGMLDEHIKIEGIAQPEAFVRFRIQDEAVPGSGEIWRENSLYDDYIRYYLGLSDQEELDYITGTYMRCSDKHPSKIRNSGDKAKLISANDSSGFTYRGRFTSREQAVSVGYIPSQEAHNALRWLIERQGYRRFGLCMVTWNPEHKEIPDWLKDDTSDLAYSGELGFSPDLGENYANEVNQAIRGKYAEFDQLSEKIIVLGVSAATPGRLSVTYYRQMSGSEFLGHLIYWHTTCVWIMSYKKQGAGFKWIMAPAPEDIVKVAYGVERNGLLHVDDKLMQDTLERLIPCIIEGKKIPTDIVRSAVGNAERPLAYGDYNRRKILEITCALIYKKYRDSNKGQKGEFDQMSLDRENKRRDYLFGRLTAVAHKIEFDTFSKEEQGKRDTNADRYRSMMVKAPQKTWLLIEKRIQPYWKKLGYGLQVKYEKELQEIHDTFENQAFSDARRLDESFLLGYYCELSDLWKSGSGSKRQEKEQDGGKIDE